MIKLMINIQKLSDYYRKRNPDKTNLNIIKIDDITGGWEAQLLKITFEYREKNQSIIEERVIRIYHGNEAYEKASKEYEILKKLSSFGFPVPKVFDIDNKGEILGKPFINMEFIKGKELSKVLNEVSKAEAEKLWYDFIKLLVELHRIEASYIFPDTLSGTTSNYFDSLFSMVKKLIEELGIHWFKTVIQWLEARRNNITSEPLSVIHFDYHTRNVMVREDGRLVVLDWTLAEYGDYRVDLAWTILIMSLYSTPSLKDDIIEKYERISGKKTVDLEYFEVIVLARRLLTIIISLTIGGEKIGMRSGAKEMIIAETSQLDTVYSMLKARTGIRLPEVKHIIESIF